MSQAHDRRTDEHRTQDQFAFLLGRCAVLWRTSLDERLRPWGMTHAAWRILRILSLGAGERFHQTRLAGEIGVETPTLVSLLDRMERKGWVRREPDPDDRRAKLVAATAEGLALGREVEGVVEEVREQMLGRLSPVELAAGIAALQKILAGGRAG